MKNLVEQLATYESPDFVDLDEVYGFSQTCSSVIANLHVMRECQNRR